MKSQVIFGQNLARIRKTLGLSQRELATLVDLTPAAICQIEQGKREPQLSTIIKILDIIPCKFETLISKGKE